MTKIPRGGIQPHQGGRQLTPIQLEDDLIGTPNVANSSYQKIQQGPLTLIDDHIRRTRRPMTPFELRINWILLWMSTGALILLIILHYLHIQP